MNYYKSDKKVILGIDLLAMIISFLTAYTLRFNNLVAYIGSFDIRIFYLIFFLVAMLIYCLVFLLREKPRLERQSYKEIWFDVIQQQVLLAAVYILLFYLFHQSFNVSRILIGLFFSGNVVLDGIGRQLYHNYCAQKSYKSQIRTDVDVSSSDIQKEGMASDNVDEKTKENTVQHVYIIGSKSIGQYGGYESFVMNLLQQHQNERSLKYHVTCKKNGNGHMIVDRLPGASMINDDEFVYYNAHCCLIEIDEKKGSAQAIDYDVKSFKWVCDHIEKNHIAHPIVYILACRIGPFEGKYARRIHKAGGKIFQNPDGHENWRSRWILPIRWYWKWSEGLMVKNADLVICDSKNIENYIKEEYAAYHPDTIWLPYGNVIPGEVLADDAPQYVNWLDNHGLKDGQFYISVGRFVPENNFEIMIREFMASHTKKDFAIITTEYPKLMSELQQKLHFERDKRIKFVGSVYDQNLLIKIRTNAYGYIHGHSVGGTNPSLLEALGTTKLNLLYSVGFNKEVAEDGAVYWTEENGNLSSAIDMAEQMSEEERSNYGNAAKERIRSVYSWEILGEEYKKCFRAAR